MLILRRLGKLKTTLEWLLPLTATPVHALWVLVQRRLHPAAALEVRYKGYPLFFRSIDSDAIEEVLHHREYAFLEPYLKSLSAPSILDVGAHIGTFAVWALGVNARARILGLEADPETASIAVRNARGRSASWEIVNRAADSVDDSTVRLSTDGASMGHHVSHEGDIEVRTVSLPTAVGLARQGGAIDLMKVDIEGSEESFICTNPECLDAVRRVVIELHPRACNTQRVMETLSARYASVIEIEGRKTNKPLLYFF